MVELGREDPQQDHQELAHVGVEVFLGLEIFVPEVFV